MPRFRLLVALVGLLAIAPAALPARAETVSIAVVDFQRALNEVAEGASVKAKLDGLYKEKKAAIDKMETQLRTIQSEYEKQSLILSETARKQKEQEITQAQMVYQQTYMASEQEMSETYNSLMQELITKMQGISQQIGKERGYTLIFEKSEGGVVYNAGAIDITNELIKRYDAANPKK